MGWWWSQLGMVSLLGAFCVVMEEGVQGGKDGVSFLSVQ
jgi:hypothetical protein